MPGKPREATKPVNSPTGTKVMHTWSVARGDQAAYMVAYMDSPAGATEQSSDALLDSARDGLLARVKGQLLSEEPETLDGHPGREIRASLRDGKAVARERMFLVGGKIYLLAAVMPASEADPPPRE